MQVWKQNKKKLLNNIGSSHHDQKKLALQTGLFVLLTVIDSDKKFHEPTSVLEPFFPKKKRPETRPAMILATGSGQFSLWKPDILVRQFGKLDS